MSAVRVEHIFGLPVLKHRWQRVITMTPEQARIIIANQPSQRPINRGNITKLRGEIMDGRFRLTHQGIAFDEDGLLRDGQHRLIACIECDTSIEVMANFNEPADLFTCYDTGTVRKVGTTLLLLGQVKSASIGNSVSGAAKFFWAYNNDRNPGHNGSVISGWNLEVMNKVLEKNPDIYRFVNELQSRRRVPYQVAPTAAMFTMFSQANEEKASVFIDQCLNGENIKKGDPAYTLRESILHYGQRQTPLDKMYKTARAWNAFYEGRKIDRVLGATRMSGTSRATDGYDPFPEIAGYKRDESLMRA
jgi:hypothetical protein